MVKTADSHKESQIPGRLESGTSNETLYGHRLQHYTPRPPLVPSHSAVSRLAVAAQTAAQNKKESAETTIVLVGALAAEPGRRGPLSGTRCQGSFVYCSMAQAGVLLDGDGCTIETHKLHTDADAGRAPL